MEYTNEHIEMVERKFKRLSEDRDYLREKLFETETTLEMYRAFLTEHKKHEY